MGRISILTMILLQRPRGLESRDLKHGFAHGQELFARAVTKPSQAATGGPLGMPAALMFSRRRESSQTKSPLVGRDEPTVSISTNGRTTEAGLHRGPLDSNLQTMPAPEQSNGIASTFTGIAHGLKPTLSHDSSFKSIKSERSLGGVLSQLIESKALCDKCHHVVAKAVPSHSPRTLVCFSLAFYPVHACLFSPQYSRSMRSASCTSHQTGDAKSTGVSRDCEKEP